MAVLEETRALCLMRNKKVRVYQDYPMELKVADLRYEPTQNWIDVLHNFGFLYDSVNLRKRLVLKKSTKNVTCMGSYQANTILPP